MPSFAATVSEIQRYPEAGVTDRQRRFPAQAKLQPYFLSEADKRSDPFLASLSASTMGRFGGRTFLTDRRRLFPSAKRLQERLLTLGPEGVAPAALGDRLVRKPCRAVGEAYYDGLCQWVGKMDWPEAIDRFTADGETAWVHDRCQLADL